MSGRDITYTKEQMQAIRARLLATETERDALTAQVARLREALADVRDTFEQDGHFTVADVETADLRRVYERARATLALLDGAK